MDWLSRIASWLSEHEATISAVVGITVLAGVLFAGLRSVLRRQAETSTDKAPAGNAEVPSAADSSPVDLDSLTVPGFAGRPAIAVLAFDNLSGDPEQEYFADGVSEDLITRLSLWRDFPVIARNSSFTYKGRPVDVKQVSRELGVRYVVEGSVRKSGERVRISAQLIDATTGSHVWAETYDRQLRDIFALQDEISEAIVASLFPELWQSEQEHAARREPDDLNAWDCVQRGFWHLFKITKGDNRKAQSLFEKGLALDPHLAMAFQGLGWTHYQDVIFQWTDSQEHSLAELVEAARRCVALDDKSAYGHWLLGVTSRLTGQQERAISSFELAIQLNPSLTFPYHDLGITLAMCGRPDEALVNLEKAMRLSPQDRNMWIIHFGVALAHSFAQRYEEAVEWVQRSIQRNPNWFLSYLVLAASYAYLDRLEEARAAVQELSRQNPDFSLAGLKLLLSAADPASAERAIDALRKAGLPE